MQTLLDTLCAAAGCSYLSDLPSLAKGQLLPSQIQAIPTNIYSLNEWGEAYQYITGAPLCATATHQVQKQLCEYVSQL